MSHLDVNTAGLERLMADFHTVTGQRMAIFDAEFKLILEYPAPHTPFCHVVRQSARGRQQCRDCDTGGMRKALDIGKTVVYRCHAGLLEVCAPVLDNGAVLGFLVFGQILYCHDADQWPQVRTACLDYYGGEAALYEAFCGVRRVDPAYIRAAAHLMTAIVEYIRLEHMMRRLPTGLWGRMTGYIEQHAYEPFSLADMSAALGVSVSSLCQTARAHAGATVGQLVLRQRMRRASDLLENTGMAISEVAAAVGIPDYNYFSRLFRRETGVTPRQHRNATVRF